MTALASREQAPPQRGAGHLLFPLVVAALAAAGAYAVYRLFVRTSLGQLVDTAALRGGDVHHPKLDEVLGRTLTSTTLVSVVLVCLVAAAIGVLRKRIDLAVGAAFLVLGANGSTELLKNRLVRPDLDHFPAPNSFPSGHTAAAASVAFALILVLPQAVRGTVALVGFCYVTVIAVATVWAEWHRPSDTIAAMLVVLAWGALAVFGIRVRRRRHPEPGERPIRLALVPLLGIGAVTTVTGLLGMFAVALSMSATPNLVSGRFAFFAGTAAMAAAAAGAFVFWVRLASGPRPAPVAAPAEAESPDPRPRAVPEPRRPEVTTPADNSPASGTVPPGPAGVPRLPSQTPAAAVPPVATVVVGSYADYALAQRAVDHLSDNKFPVERTAIIGTDLRLVENVLGRLTTARAAGAGLASGAWFGLLIGLLLGIFSNANWFAVIFVCLLIGAAWGAVFGAIAHAATGGRRDFASRSSLQAGQYAVTADAEVAEQGRQLLVQLNWRASGAV